MPDDRRHRAAAAAAVDRRGRRAAARRGTRARDWHRDFPREDDRDAASMWRDGDPWGPRSIVLDGVVVGSIGFFGPPETADDGVPEAEVGYGLVEEARGAGLATEALAAPARRRPTRPAYGCAPACAPTTPPSIRVLAKCGFTELRGSNEDGELVMARPLRG